MYEKDTLCKNIKSIIEQSRHMTDEQKNIWSEVFCNLVEYQEELLTKPNFSNDTIQDSTSWNIVCGLTNTAKPPKEFEFVSCTDSVQEFKDSTIFDDKNTVLKTFAIGYLDVPYEELYNYCGNKKTYIGLLPDNSTEFTYHLILKETLLFQEKEILYRLASMYNISAPVIYAPYFRRLVYLESECDNIKGCDLRLAENNLKDKLKLNYRSIWNVAITSNPAGIKKEYSFHYMCQKNEFILYDPKYDYELDREVIENADGREVIITPKNVDINVKELMQKVEVKPIESSTINSQYYCVNKGSYICDIDHIYSEADIFNFLEKFSDVVQFVKVHREYPEGMTICTYENHFDYPILMPCLQERGRAIVYLEFEHDTLAMLFDRIAYVIHQIQRLFPEYVWKGGYL